MKIWNWFVGNSRAHLLYVLTTANDRKNGQSSRVRAVCFASQWCIGLPVFDDNEVCWARRGKAVGIRCQQRMLSSGEPFGVQRQRLRGGWHSTVRDLGWFLILAACEWCGLRSRGGVRHEWFRVTRFVLFCFFFLAYVFLNTNLIKSIYN